jgi:hypothetical protein
MSYNATNICAIGGCLTYPYAISNMQTYASTFDVSATDKNNKNYYNGVLSNNSHNDTKSLSDHKGEKMHLYISGAALSGDSIFSPTFGYRLYNRALTPSEIAQNAAVDQLRFQSVPAVKIGNSACTNVIVISTTQLKCTAPSGTNGTTVDVTVTDSGGVTKTITNAYTYSSTFYIDTITPNVGPTFGGTPLTLTGNGFGTNASNIVSVTVGEVNCPLRSNPSVANSNTSYTCSIPEMQEDGFKNVVVTVQGGTSYTFANAFRYVEATRDPLKANVQRGKSALQNENSL